MLILPGYYIHSCQKMRYKALYRPQYILGKFFYLDFHLPLYDD